MLQVIWANVASQQQNVSFHKKLHSEQSVHHIHNRAFRAADQTECMFQMIYYKSMEYLLIKIVYSGNNNKC